MKKMKIWRIMFMALAVFYLASCSDAKDGDWDPMVWKAEVSVQSSDGAYIVSPAGDELTFSCRNYSRPWIENAESGGEYIFPHREANDFCTITAEWFKAEISENRLSVVFDANETGENRTVQLTVTAGDIFHTFKFKQPVRGDFTTIDN